MLKELLKPEIKTFIRDKKWADLKRAISAWPVQDIAELLEELEPAEMIILFRLLPKQLAIDTFGELNHNAQETLLKQMSEKQTLEFLMELAPDDRTDLFEELPGKLMQRLLNMLPPEERRESLNLLGYPENSIGRLMTPDYVAIHSNWTVQETLEHIRKYGHDAETISTIFVVDSQWHLLDEISLERIVLTNPTVPIENIMDRQVVYLEATADQEEAVKMMKHYDLNVLPVVDSEKILIGIVTIDDVIDIMEQEDTEDFTKISAIDPEHIGMSFISDLRRAPIYRLYRSRVTWLITLLIMDLFTGGIIQRFQDVIAKYVVLVTFLPVLVDTAGNAGGQAATLTIRSFALGTINLKDWGKLISKELLVSSLLGLTMGIGISIMGLIRGGWQVAQVVILSMVVNVVIGSLIGITLPFIFTRFKRDPATASTPLITTLADIIGTFIYLSFAFLLLSGK